MSRRGRPRRGETAAEAVARRDGAATVSPATFTTRGNGAAMPANDGFGGIGFMPGGSKPPRPIGAARAPVAIPAPMPAPELAPPPTVQQAAAPAPTAPPPHTTPVGGPVAFAPPEGQNNAANAANNYSDQRRARDAYDWRRAKQVPQGETLLVHAWCYALTCYPPQGLTVWFRRVDPAAGAYQFYLTGDQLVGDFPDRKLYDEARRNRRQPTIAEKFVGRIRALTPDGGYVEAGGGEIEFPPEPTNAQPPWANPTNPWGPPPSTWGSPWPSMPYGGAGYFGAAGHYGYPGWGGGAAGGWNPNQPPPWFEEWAKRSGYGAQPPASIQHDPMLMEVWKTLHASILQAQANGNQDPYSKLNEKLLNLAFERLGNDSGKKDDPLDRLDKIIGIVDKLRGDSGSKGGVTIHDLGGGTRVVEDKDGNIDPTTSSVLSLLPEAKEMLKERRAAIAARAAQNATGVGGSKPPAARPTNGTPKPPAPSV